MKSAAGALYDKYCDKVSRRVLHAAVQACARDVEKKKEAMERRIEGDVAGSVWSMDDLEKNCLQENKGYVHLVMDPASRKTLGVLGDDVLARGLRVRCLSPAVKSFDGSVVANERRYMNI